MTLISRRLKTHGNWREQASFSQTVKELFKSGKNWDQLNDGQREALEMLAVKISRALHGDHNYRDHWDDMVGYAQLGVDSCATNMPTVTLDLQEAMSQ